MNQNERKEEQEAINADDNSSLAKADQTESEQKKTSTGLEENIAGLLCYLVWPITGIIFFILEKDNQFIRFHALQSIITIVALFILRFALGAIPAIGWLMEMMIGLLTLALWIVLMVKAYQKEKFKLPVIGDIAEQQIK